MYIKFILIQYVDASVVKAEGVGLKDSVTGQKSHFFISTLDAGSGKCVSQKTFHVYFSIVIVYACFVVAIAEIYYVGTLSVTMDGPAKVSLDCTETEDGYKAR